MPTYVQADRPLSVTTPLSNDDLLLVGLSGDEGISQLFNFQLELVADNNTDIPFEKLLGQNVTAALSLPNGKKRFFNGICKRVSQGERGNTFTQYRMEIVPRFWLLTRRARSKTFLKYSVPDILKAVLDGLDVAPPELQGTFPPRNHVYQHRETDFNFASRIMEEEGIYYFFKHDNGSHQMVLANTPLSHPDVPVVSKIIYETMEGGTRDEGRVHSWEKVQELRSGKYTLWDHSFEMPGKHLEADKSIQESVVVGTVTHKLKVGSNSELEIYDYPGEYAQRFDGVDKGGAEQAAELQKIFQDNKRVAEIRMQEEALASVQIRGTSDCGQFMAGHQFTLDRHFNANGAYALTSVTHSAHLAGDYQSGGGGGVNYHNNFTCIPLALPFRPPRNMPKPLVPGTQTAVVVGPPGEEIFCDKYGRVKVQFHWDRDGKYDADSSCWIRVSTIWAGKTWGAIHIPRIGQEVVVDFLEGDPDKPIIVGSVYNADHMPPGKLPDDRMVSGMRSSTYPKGGGYNCITANDAKGKEILTIHAQKDMSTTVENDQTLLVRNDRSNTVDGKFTEKIKKDTKITITEGDYAFAVSKGKADISVKGPVTEVFDNTQATTVTQGIDVTSKSKHIHLTADTEIVLTVKGSQITINPDSITLKSANIHFEGGKNLTGKAPHVGYEGTTDLTAQAPTVTIDGKTQATLQGATVDVAAKSKLTAGAGGEGGQAMMCDTAQVLVSGAKITSSSSGVHEIVGSLVKIN